MENIYIREQLSSGDWEYPAQNPINDKMETSNYFLFMILIFSISFFHIGLLEEPLYTFIINIGTISGSRISSSIMNYGKFEKNLHYFLFIYSFLFTCGLLV